MIIYTNQQHFESEIKDVVKLFFSNTEIVSGDNLQADIVHTAQIVGDDVVNNCCYANFSSSLRLTMSHAWNDLEKTRYLKRYAKLAVYNCLAKATGKRLPWGSLTGIRPTKLAYEIMQNEDENWQEVFENTLDVSKQKISLVADILDCQRGLRKAQDNRVDVYVGVPFCVSRCSYCSFTSGVIDKLAKFVEPYIDTVCREIELAFDLIERKNLFLSNIYVGGGTPTSLSASQLERLLRVLFNYSKRVGGSLEFTVEAGRPDTIDGEKLDVMAKCGVNRTSINPQSFNQVILDTIGRKHSVEDIYQTFELAKKYPFVINTDLIAGLPDETFEQFSHSINSAIALSPDNITVHSLALKKGSQLKISGAAIEQENLVGSMVDYAQKRLYDANYAPYYLYRQKYVSQNLENVGYCKQGKQCLYNIDIMEETTSIIACGCNAISKRVFCSQNRIERQANAKDVKTYIEQADRFFEAKQKLFD